MSDAGLISLLGDIMMPIAVFLSVVALLGLFFGKPR